MVRYFAQFLTILVFYLLGNGLVTWFSLPLSGSIVGMILLFIALILGICDLKWVESVAQLHIKHITLLFIPFAVGIWHFTRIFRNEGVKLSAILAVSSMVVLIITAIIAEIIETNSKRSKQNGEID
ncbi:CidA/LrgA family protein [Neobacillus bataviensis]|uniref:CidA/LrgA family protein n=1 Tax=Neobacillus bataviensis TaxID=220685 RepID=UPI001CBF6179|nr:CidA/LrgA family protein [Neobacillus bataviensis]